MPFGQHKKPPAREVGGAKVAAVRETARSRHFARLAHGAWTKGDRASARIYARQASEAVER